MLLRITKSPDLDGRQLMDVYSESNLENTDFFYPGESDKAAAVAGVEAGFLDFLENEFFHLKKATYWVWEEDGVWISALRICEIRQGAYYLEALETRPDRRGKGYGSRLLLSVLEEMKKEGPFRLLDCVSKKNLPSLRTHEKCGFQIVSQKGYDYLHEEADDRDYGLEYSYCIN